MKENLTPLLRQYKSIKERFKDAILFFRMGDFYEMFYEDAIVASKILEIALTTRDKRSPDPVPMCGIPYHALNSYLPKLIREGYKVAICEQVENPAEAKGIVKREVVKIVTPGTLLDGDLLEPGDNNFIASLYGNGPSGLAFMDISTGDFFITESRIMEDILTEFTRIEPKEIIIPPDMDLGDFIKRQSYKICINTYPEEIFENPESMEEVKRYIQSEDHMDMSNLNLSLKAASALLFYLRETQKTAIRNINAIKILRPEEYMTIDETTRDNLEIVRSLRGDKRGSLFYHMDRTITPMGGRLLKHWLLHPLMNIHEIRTRQDAVEELVNHFSLREEIRNILKSISDMERIISRISLRAANARDLVALRRCIERLPDLRNCISSLSASLFNRILQMLDPLEDVGKLIAMAIADDPPLSITEGGIIRDGYNEELDELRMLSRETKKWLASFEARERKRTGIESLKVRYNRVFGYYIEVTKANLKYVPSEYMRKQTLVNAERFITPELKDYESRILGAEERIKGLEYSLFEEIRENISSQAKRIQVCAKGVALIDVISSLADLAHRHNYVKPSVDDSLNILIREGRHPVVEAMEENERFVPNDTEMDCDKRRVMILTGPNMAGKSTYMRQVALIVLMAQMGSFVPAREATIGIVDRIFTRIGASDNLARGKSTFMIEMEETAHIVKNATRRSLILLDEIGRGTSTFDGISIAWATAEYINRHIKAKTLFATHYHELTDLALTEEGIFNTFMAVREWNDEVIFLRKIMPGISDKSYGIQVAKLAGLPEGIIKRAKEVLASLEEGEFDMEGKPRLARTDKDKEIPSQIDLFTTYSDHPVLDEIRTLDILNMTPLQALTKLEELQRLLKEQQEKF